MDLGEFAFATTQLVGFVNIVLLALDKNWRSFTLAMTAVIAGGLFGYFHLFGVPSLEIGIALGIASSGAYKMLQVVKAG